MGNLVVLLGSFYLAFAKMISQHWENRFVDAVAKFRKMFPSLVLYLVTCAGLIFLVMLVQFQPISLLLKVAFFVYNGCFYDGQLFKCFHVLIHCNTFSFFVSGLDEFCACSTFTQRSSLCSREYILQSSCYSCPIDGLHCRR